MSLYIPRHFAADDRVRIARLIHDHPFATVLTRTADGFEVTHLPMIYVADAEPHGTLLGHVARANPHWRRLAGAPTTVIFQGPHHYVSPSWYLEPEGAVPTWNYAVVHVYGEAALIEDRAETEGVLQLMIARFETGLPNPWSLALTEDRLAAMLSAIVAFRIRVRRWDGKFKLSQNREADDRRRVATALRNLGTDEAVALAEWMRLYAGT